MKKNKYIFRKAVPFLVSLLLVLSAIDGHAAVLQKHLRVGVKGPQDVANGGWIVVTQAGNTSTISPCPAGGCTAGVLFKGYQTMSGGTSDLAVGNNLLDVNDSGDITFEAHVSNSGTRTTDNRVVWYVNGYKLQGTSFSVLPDETGANFNWRTAVSTGISPLKAGTCAINTTNNLVSHVLTALAPEATRITSGRNEVLKISTAQIPYVREVQVEFVRDIAHLAVITASSRNTSNGTNDNGNEYSCLVENTGGWRPDNKQEGNDNTTAPYTTDASALVHAEIPFGAYDQTAGKAFPSDGNNYGTITGAGNLPTANQGFTSTLNLTSTYKWIRFTFTGAQRYIDRIEVRRRNDNASYKITKFQVVYKCTNGNAEIVALPAKTLDVRTGDPSHNHNNLLTDPKDRVNPDKNGDMDQVVYLTYNGGGNNNRGIKPVAWIEIRILEWKKGNGANDPVGLSPDAGSPVAFERIRIIEAQPIGIDGGDAYPWRPINWGVINGTGGEIAMYSGGFIEGTSMSCSRDNNNHLELRSRSTVLFNPEHSFLKSAGTYGTFRVTNPIGRLVNSYLVHAHTTAGKTPNPTRNVAGGVTNMHLNNMVHFVAKPDLGYRVKWFKVTGLKGSTTPVYIANRTSYNYKNISTTPPTIHQEGGTTCVKMDYCLGEIGTRGNGWPLIANGLSDRTAHTPGSIDDTTPYATEIIGFPVYEIGDKTGQAVTFTVEVEFEKEPILYSTITASHENHDNDDTNVGNQSNDNMAVGCKYGVTAGPGNWSPGAGPENTWLDFKFDKGIAGKKRIKAARLYTRTGDRPQKVRFDFYTGSISNINSTYDRNLNPGGGVPVYNYCQFCKALPSDGMRLTIVEGPAPAGSKPGTGFQRIQLEEVETSITGITTVPSATGVINSPCSTLQFTATVSPSTADYNSAPFCAYTWKVTDMSGNPTTLAAIDSNGTLFPLHKGNGQVKVFAEANDGSGVTSTPVVVTISGQPKLTPGAKAEITYLNLNHLVTSSTHNVNIKATITPMPAETEYQKVVWTVSPMVCATFVRTDSLNKIPSKIEPIVFGVLTDALDITIMRPFLNITSCADAGGDMTVNVALVPDCSTNFSTYKENPGSSYLPACYGCGPLNIPGVSGDNRLIKVRNATDIESPFISSLNLYPVPFATTIQISDAAGAVLQIKNIAGITVLTQQISGANETLNLSQLAAGMYFFCFEKDGQTKMVKVVKN